MRALCVLLRVYSITVSQRTDQWTHTHLCSFDHYRDRPPRLVRCPTSISPYACMNALQQSVRLCQVYRIWLHESWAATLNPDPAGAPFGAPTLQALAFPAGACFPSLQLLHSQRTTRADPRGGPALARLPHPGPPHACPACMRCVALRLLTSSTTHHCGSAPPASRRPLSATRPRVPQTPTPHSDMSTYKK